MLPDNSHWSKNAATKRDGTLALLCIQYITDTLRQTGRGLLDHMSTLSTRRDDPADTVPVEMDVQIETNVPKPTELFKKPMVVEFGRQTT